MQRIRSAASISNAVGFGRAKPRYYYPETTDYYGGISLSYLLVKAFSSKRRAASVIFSNIYDGTRTKRILADYRTL
jgi:hypothetical protein